MPIETSASKYQWAPIVWARTYTVGFRLIVAPSFFANNQDVEWAWKHIIDATEYAEQLASGSRLLLFQNAAFRVHGVMCMVSDLIGKQDPMERDLECRHLYAFLGYASMCDDSGVFPAVPTYATALTLYGGLHDYVRRHWEDTDYLNPSERAEPNRTELSPIWWTPDTIIDTPEIANSPAEHLVELNDDPAQLLMWPDSLDTRVRLWQAASCYGTPISLCLGLAFKFSRNAKTTSFLNATVAGTAEGGARIEKYPPTK